MLEYFDRIWLLDTNRAFHAEAENHRVKKATAILARRWTEINDTKQLTAINWETETLQTNEVALLSGDCTAWNKEPMLLNTLTTLMQKGEQNIVLQTPYMICNQAMYNAPTMYRYRSLPTRRRVEQIRGAALIISIIGMIF